MANEYPSQSTSCQMTRLVKATAFRDHFTDPHIVQLEQDRLGLLCSLHINKIQ